MQTYPIRCGGQRENDGTASRNSACGIGAAHSAERRQYSILIRAERRQTLGLRWLVSFARARGERTMRERLAGEILDGANNAGNAVKKKEDTHRMAEANKAFAHYRW